MYRTNYNEFENRIMIKKFVYNIFKNISNESIDEIHKYGISNNKLEEILINSISIRYKTGNEVYFGVSTSTNQSINRNLQKNKMALQMILFSNNKYVIVLNINFKRICWFIIKMVPQILLCSFDVVSLAATIILMLINANECFIETIPKELINLYVKIYNEFEYCSFERKKLISKLNNDTYNEIDLENKIERMIDKELIIKKESNELYLNEIINIKIKKANHLKRR